MTEGRRNEATNGGRGEPTDGGRGALSVGTMITDSMIGSTTSTKSALTIQALASGGKASSISANSRDGCGDGNGDGTDDNSSEEAGGFIRGTGTTRAIGRSFVLGDLTLLLSSIIHQSARDATNTKKGMKQRSIETEKQKKRYETKVDRDPKKGPGVPAYPLARFAAFRKDWEADGRTRRCFCRRLVAATGDSGRNRDDVDSASLTSGRAVGGTGRSLLWVVDDEPTSPRCHW